MRYGVIDIGSNTIHAVVYGVRGRSFSVLHREKESTGLLNYVADGVLSEAGVMALLGALGRLYRLCMLLRCAEIHAFATASLRGLTNGAAVLAAAARAGFAVRVLSGEEEAACDHAGLLAAGRGEQGVGFDLGGGSAQVFSFAGGVLRESASLSLGSLRMYRAFVRGVLPTPAEQAAVRAYAAAQLTACPGLRGAGLQTAFAIGGTARAAAKLHRAFTGGRRQLDGYPLSLREQEVLLRLFEDGRGVRLLEQAAPERLTTFVPGLLVIGCILRHVGAQGMEVVKNGIREGYLCRHLLRREA